MDDEVANSADPLNLARERDDNEEGGGAGEASGFLKNFMVSVQGNGKQKEEDKEEEGGIISNVISNLLSPRSSKETAAMNRGATGSGVEDNGGGGRKTAGCQISDLFERGEEVAKAEEKEKENDEGVKRKEEKEEEDEDGGGGGIIDNIVSHLPASFQGEAVTSTDEASLLIHSIVHD